MPLPYRVLLIQTVGAGLLAVLALLSSAEAAFAAALAGAAVVVPGLWFARCVVRADVPPAAATSAARALVLHGLIKQVIAALALVLVFAAYEPEPLAFFATFIVLQGAYWLTPLMGVPRSRATQ